MKKSRLFSGLGAVALAVASVSAQAGTRAADAGAFAVQPVKMSVATDGVSRSALSGSELNEMGGGSGVIIAVIAAALVILGIVVASDGDDRSSGAS